MAIKPALIYRLSRDGEFLYLRIPDDDTESDGVLRFNRVMADLGYPNPSEIFNKRLGFAVVKPVRRIIVGDTLETVDMLLELGKFFRLTKISKTDWYTKRF